MPSILQGILFIGAGISYGICRLLLSFSALSLSDQVALSFLAGLTYVIAAVLDGLEK